jgi:hypothetical protein
MFKYSFSIKELINKEYKNKIFLEMFYLNKTHVQQMHFLIKMIIILKMIKLIVYMRLNFKHFSSSENT